MPCPWSGTEKATCTPSRAGLIRMTEESKEWQAKVSGRISPALTTKW